MTEAFSRGFGSDNHAPIHPRILQSIAEHNLNHSPSYGIDHLSFELNQYFKKNFTLDTESYLVFNGTAANTLSLQTLIKPYQSSLVTDVSHLNNDEAAAPEFFAGKLVPIKSLNGKFIFSELEKAIIRKGDQHFSQIKAISLTQPTELGTVYTLDELSQIVEWAKKNNLFVHMDGARFNNAVISIDVTPAQMTTELGIDILSYGGTKNGLLFGECVLIFNPALQSDFKYIRKMAGQLPSKTKFMAAQFMAYHRNQLCFDIARHCLTLAQYFKTALQNACPHIQIAYPIESNALFLFLPKRHIKKLKQKFFFYVWNEITTTDCVECRLMISWDTQQYEIDEFISLLKDLE